MKLRELRVRYVQYLRIMWEMLSERGVTQEEVAQRAGVTRQAISRILEDR